MPPARDPNIQCTIENFGKTRLLLNEGARVRAAIIAELGKEVPDWSKLRPLIIKLRANDMNFRRENHRVELLCLDKTAFDKRISYLRNEFRNVEPPPVFLPK